MPTIDCADPFIIAILRLEKYVDAQQKPLLEKMVNQVEGAKLCFLLDNVECVRKALQVIGVDGFTKLASMSTGKLQQVYLTAKAYDIAALKKIAHMQNGNLLQFLLEFYPTICGLLNKKAALANAYSASMSKAQ